jgi:hypothetical protein
MVEMGDDAWRGCIRAPGEYARLQELDDPRCPEEPLRADEAEAVYRALERAKKALMFYANADGKRAKDALAEINTIMKGAR